MVTKTNGAAKKRASSKPVESVYPTDGFAKPKEAAKFLGFSERTVYRMIEEDELPNVKFRNARSGRIPWPALHAIKNETMGQSAQNSEASKTSG